MLDRMDSDQIRELLEPFASGLELNNRQIWQISAYLDLVLKWNAKMNLTAVREPGAIIQRHFGESLFAAGLIAPNCGETKSLADVGSGAGFPGLAIKIALPQLNVTLIESQQKKATFLREVIRELAMQDAQVVNARAESFHQTSDIVTLRAVESFDKSLRVASRLVGSGGELVLLIGTGQTEKAGALLPHFQWIEPNPIPQSYRRVILIARRT